MINHRQYSNIGTFLMTANCFLVCLIDHILFGTQILIAAEIYARALVEIIFFALDFLGRNKIDFINYFFIGNVETHSLLWERSLEKVGQIKKSRLVSF